MRRFFFTIIFILLLSSCAYGDAALYVGTRNIGAVPIIEAKSGYLVPVDGVGQLLGFTARGNSDEVLLSRKGVSIRVIAGSAAAWRGTSLVPMLSPAIGQDGRIWIEPSSAVSLFQSFAGRGQASRLRFAKVLNAAPTTSTIASSFRSDVEFGRFAEQPDPEVQETPSPVEQPEPVELFAATKTTPEEQPKPEVSEEQPKPEVAATPATPTAAKSKQDTPKVRAVASAVNTASRTITSTKAQPRHETFKPSDNKKPSSESWSGTIQSIRWTDQESTNRKIRAVIVADDNADPQVYMADGKLHALFASSLENASALASPYPAVKTELKKSNNGMELIFTPEDITRAEKTILTSPRRIVFDFFLPQDVAIAKNTPEQPEPEAQPIITVEPVAETPKPEPAPPAQETVKRAEPIIIVNNDSINPTPESDVTVTAARPSRDRKIIVIDPGHGGKDPGASANNVTEKNVNLGIGLELERILSAQGFSVIMTRKTDVYLKLQERTDIANNADADLFVSIHVNALPSKTSLTGFEIYIMALPTDKDAMDLAKIENREYVEGKGYDAENVDRRTELLLRILGDMQQNNKISESTEFAAALYNAGARGGLPMRRVAQAPFFVLRGAGMPAVLIETGFVTNAEEAHMLMTPEYQNQIARAMAAGITSYLR